MPKSFDFRAADIDHDIKMLTWRMARYGAKPELLARVAELKELKERCWQHDAA